MLRKVFLLPLFGTPFPWVEQYLAHVRSLESYGWYWKVFTPHSYQSSGNVEIVPMTLVDFDELVKTKCEVEPDNHLLESGAPAKLMSDYHPVYGHLFEDYTHGFDYWGHTNWDMVYGRLDHFIPDAKLAECDIWADDCGHINGIFTLYRNQPEINRLYQNVRGWPSALRREPGVPLVGFDEFYFNNLIRTRSTELGVRFAHPPYFAHHSYDRLVQHRPEPNLVLMPDGALLERFEDDFPNIVNYAPWPGYFGREIMSFHFIRTKRWPRLQVGAPR